MSKHKYEQLKQLIIDNGDAKDLDEDYSTCGTRKRSGRKRKWNHGLNVSQKMHIMDATDNRDSLNNPYFYLQDKID